MPQARLLGARRILAAVFFLVLHATFQPAPAGTLLSSNAVWRLFRGTREASLPDTSAWRLRNFDDTAWTEGPAPVFYGEPVDGGTEIQGMQNQFLSVFLRTHVPVANPAGIARLVLRAVIDDGAVFWLNGTELTRYNLGTGPLPFNTNALAAVPEPHVWQEWTFEDLRGLTAGDNVLAVQLLNTSLGSSDILFDAELTFLERESNPPTVIRVAPAPGEVTNLTRVTVTFNEPVQGIDAADLSVGGTPATRVSGAGAEWTFEFPAPPFGPVAVFFPSGHGISDRAVPPNGFLETAPGSAWHYTYVDPVAPHIVRRAPPAGAIVRQLTQVEITFNEAVQGVSAASLRIDGHAATSVAGSGAGPYLFRFPAVSSGTAILELSAAAPAGVITDLDTPPQSLVTTPWSISVDPSANAPAVRINEILAVNASGLKDEDGESSAWIELFNPGPEGIPLEEWSLSDDPDVPDQWLFPPIRLEPGQYLVVFADAKDRRDPARPLHANFRLARDGEYLGLFNPESPRRPVSEIKPGYPYQRTDVSLGRRGSGDWGYFPSPTPGRENGETAISEACEPVHFSVPRGNFQGSFEVVLTTPTPGATILFSTDGSEPAPGGPGLVYERPIPIRGTTVLRAVATRSDRIPSAVATHTYLANENLTRRSLPALSLATASNNITGRTGIVGIGNGYRNTTQRGIAWERPVSVEYIDAENGGFQANAGLRLQASDYFRPRLEPGAKFSWRLYFRGDYGDTKLRYPLIPESDRDDYDVIVCRAGSNDPVNPFIRDELIRRLHADCGQVASLGTFVSLYLNGVYKGYYNPCDRIEADFLQAHHGGGELWDVMSQSGPIDGNTTEFNRLMTFVRNTTFTSDASYRQLASRVDLVNFVDYLLVNIFANTGDWPHNNWRAARERRDGALWRFYIWDAEWGWGYSDAYPISGNTFGNQLAGDVEIPTLYKKAVVHPEFRLLFADRIQKHFFNGGALDGISVSNRYLEMNRLLARTIPSMDRSILTTWIPQRRRIIFPHFSQRNLLAGSNAPALLLPQGALAPGTPVTLSNAGGDIYFTLDGSDPRTPFTGAASASAQKYDSNAPPRIAGTTLVRARSLRDNAWSALTERLITVTQGSPPIHFTEIMAEPAGGQTFEYLEFANVSSHPIDLSGWSVEGINLTFTSGTSIPAGAVWTLAPAIDLPRWKTRYPGVIPAALYGGSLNNSGERIALVDDRGRTITAVRYSTRAGWPKEAELDGTRSLERISTGGSPSDPSRWQVSAPGGTPGRWSPVTPAPSPGVAISEALAEQTATESSVLATGWIELHNQSTSTVPLAGWRLEVSHHDDPFSFPADANLPPNGRLVVHGRNTPGNPSLASRLLFPSSGADVGLYDGTGHRIAALSYGPQPAGYSIGIADDTVTLLVPTPGAPNQPAPLTPPTQVWINEWLANPPDDAPDWIELHNGHPSLPAPLGGLSLAVASGGTVADASLHPAGFIGPAGHVLLFADDDPGADHLDVKLPASGSVIRLETPEGTVLDTVTYTQAPEGVSRGRLPDGGVAIEDFPLTATPGRANALTPPLGIRFNEVLAHFNDALAGPRRNSDWVELANPASATRDLTGYRLERDWPTPRSWTIPAGTTMPARGWLRIWCDPLLPPTSATGPEPNTGWDLPDLGTTLRLRPAAGALEDVVTFGPQIRGRSIGRIDGDRWTLLDSPTPGAANSTAATLGGAGALTMNEWSTGSGLGADWIELYNTASNPVSFEGLRITDDPSLSGVNRHAFAPLSYVDGRGFLVFRATANPHPAPDELSFALSALGESLRLYSPQSNLIDAVTLLPALGGLNATVGRVPDGTGFATRLSVATPGAPNLLDTDGDGLPDDWESAHGLNPADPRDAGLDPDADGAPSRDEYVAGTHPRDPQSRLQLEIRLPALGVIQFVFDAAPYRSYSVMTRTSSPDGTWEKLRDFPAGPDAGRVDNAFFSPTGRERYFQLVTPAAP